MFKILSPVCSVKELRELIRHGADEFYFGVLPRDDLETSDFQINRRPYATSNFKSLDEVSDAIRISHGENRKMYVTLNEHVYNGEQFDDVFMLSKKLWDMGVDGFFVSNISVMRMLKREFGNPFIIASVGAHIHNDMAVRFYKGLGVKRIILPRHLLIEEISEITKNNKDVGFEVFIHNFFCDNIDGLCQFSHGLIDSDKGDCEPACLEDKTFAITSSRKVGPKIRAHIEKKLKMLKQTYTENCGLCFAYDFSKMNIESLKIIGRDNPTEKKVKDVMVMKAIRDAIPLYKNRGDFASFVRGLYNRVYGKDCRYKCIYGR